MSNPITIDDFDRLPIYIGYRGENLVTGIDVDLSGVLPDGWGAALWMRRPTQSAAYQKQSNLVGKVLHAVFDSGDTYILGRGEAVLELYGPDGELKKTATTSTVINYSLTTGGEPPDDPEIYRTAAQQDVIDAGKLSKAAQETKTEEMTQPVGVDENGKLWALPGGGSGTDALWRPSVDSAGNISWEKSSSATPPASQNIKGQPGTPGADGQDGITPTIGNNGNWYLGDTDTGKPSRGEQGTQGIQGVPGTNGTDGQDGEDGYSPAVTITQITGGHTVKITDKTHTSGQTFDVMDGADGQDGSDAEVTEENIIAALGYTPADVDGMNAITRKLEYIDTVNWFDQTRTAAGALRVDGTVDTTKSGVIYGTDYIPVDTGDIVSCCVYNAPSIPPVYAYPFFSYCAYNSAYEPLSDKGASYGWSSDTKEFTVPSDVSYIRVSMYTHSDIMILRNTAIPMRYVPNAAPKWIATREFLEKISPISVADSFAGAEYRITSFSDGVTSGNLPDFPYHLKRGFSMIFYAEFSSFSYATLGNQTGYRGRRIAVNNSSVIQYYDGDNGVQQEVSRLAHGLTLEAFICIEATVTVDGILHFVVMTKGGSFSGEFDWHLQQQGRLAFQCGSGMTGKLFGAAAEELRKPVWCIGDSYCEAGVTTGILGQLRLLGYGDGLMMDAVPGQTSSGAYDELLRCLNHGAPKFLIWMLGLNDTSNVDGAKRVFDNVIYECEKRGIKLVAEVLPLVPERDEGGEAINEYVASKNVRLFNVAKAVGADESAAGWYAGYLSSDDVHPTALGARAIAVRFLVDFPEITQFGYDQKYTVDTDGKTIINIQPGVPEITAEAIEEALGYTPADEDELDAKADKPVIKTVMDSVATVNTQYYLGTQSAVSIALPSNAAAGDQITAVWYNGATAATLSITGTMLDCDYAPSANSRSEINALWDGTYWAVVTNEQAVTS